MTVSAGSAGAAGRVLVGVLLSWALPGAGHAYLGRRGKGLLYFGLITFTFLFGMWLGDFRAVSADNFRIYLLAQSFFLGGTGPALLLCSGLELDHPMPFLEAGVLFTSVAGLLNVCVMVDVYETVFGRSNPAAETSA